MSQVNCGVLKVNLLLLDFQHDVVQNLLIAHQLKPVFWVGELLVDLGGIEQIQCPLGKNCAFLNLLESPVALRHPL